MARSPRRSASRSDSLEHAPAPRPPRDKGHGCHAIHNRATQGRYDAKPKGRAHWMTWSGSGACHVNTNACMQHVEEEKRFTRRGRQQEPAPSTGTVRQLTERAQNKQHARTLGTPRRTNTQPTAALRSAQHRAESSSAELSEASREASREEIVACQRKLRYAPTWRRKRCASKRGAHWATADEEQRPPPEAATQPVPPARWRAEASRGSVLRAE